MTASIVNTTFRPLRCFTSSSRNPASSRCCDLSWSLASLQRHSTRNQNSQYRRDRTAGKPAGRLFALHPSPQNQEHAPQANHRIHAQLIILSSIRSLQAQLGNLPLPAISLHHPKEDCLIVCCILDISRLSPFALTRRASSSVAWSQNASMLPNVWNQLFTSFTSHVAAIEPAHRANDGLFVADESSRRGFSRNCWLASKFPCAFRTVAPARRAPKFAL